MPWGDSNGEGTEVTGKLWKGPIWRSPGRVQILCPHPLLAKGHQSLTLGMSARLWMELCQALCPKRPQLPLETPEGTVTAIR